MLLDPGWTLKTLRIGYVGMEPMVTKRNVKANWLRCGRLSHEATARLHHGEETHGLFPPWIFFLFAPGPSALGRAPNPPTRPDHT